MSGDALTDVDLGALIESHKAKGALATLAVKEVADPSLFGVVVAESEGRVIGFQEKPPREDALSHICNCGIYVFQPEVFEHIPNGRFYDFGRQLFPAMVAAGERTLRSSGGRVLERRGESRRVPAREFRCPAGARAGRDSRSRGRLRAYGLASGHMWPAPPPSPGRF